MSGSMMPQQAQQAPPALPPQILQALMMQRAQQGGGMPGQPPGGGMAMPPQMPPRPPMMPQPGMPPMAGGMPPGPPGPPPGAPGMAGPPMPPRPQLPPGGLTPPGAQGAPNPALLSMFGRAAGASPGGPQGMNMNPAEAMAMKGRFGDTILAHLTPGEITIPVQLQSPAVLNAIRAEFKKVGVSPAKFVAGSPVGSHNPATGAQEFSWLPALLSVLGGVGGSLVAPGVGTAIGAGLGGAVGEKAAGGSFDQALITGLASGAGSAVAPAVGAKLGNLWGTGLAGQAATGATMGAGGAALQGGNPLQGALQGGVTGSLGAALPATPNPVTGNSLSASTGIPQNTIQSLVQAAPSAAPVQSQGNGGLLGTLMSPRIWGGGIGAGIGSAFAGPTGPQPNGLPPGFNDKMPALNPNFNQLLGNSNGSQVNFNGFSPATVANGPGFNFYRPM